MIAAALAPVVITAASLAVLMALQFLCRATAASHDTEEEHDMYDQLADDYARSQQPPARPVHVLLVLAAVAAGLALFAALTFHLVGRVEIETTLLAAKGAM